MSELEKYKRLVLGRKLSNLFFTKQDGPYDYRPGISPAYYFSTVMELDDTVKLHFGNDFITDWISKEPLFMVTNRNWALPKELVFKGQKIIDLTIGEEEQLVFHLENGITIMHTIDYGDQLFIKNIK
ncbi:hypothetical protein QWZ06_16780 [Chryseobacterium tructae]|uniref:Uncharacterized protein n=1 Tax=Chryseobacterium tructae TaxID=1037380 RepID=A0ABV7Y150_9FLAO|nr:hypothetical protein [Chryseobacterium tructae]MDN3693828.1 hypothetical protein [Chryseobacterium tructae]